MQTLILKVDPPWQVLEHGEGADHWVHVPSGQIYFIVFVWTVSAVCLPFGVSLDQNPASALMQTANNKIVKSETQAFLVDIARG